MRAEPAALGGLHRRRSCGEGIPGDDSRCGIPRCPGPAEGRLLLEIVFGEHEADHEVVRSQERRRGSGETLDRGPDEVPPLRPGAVVVPYIRVAEEVLQEEPRVRGPRSDPSGFTDLVRVHKYH